MKKSPKPEFPAILVEDDGSLELIFSNTEWTDDVDHWFWSSAEVFLIDQRLNRFEPVANRSQDGRPVEVPTWRRVTTITPEVVERLIANDPHSDPGDPSFTLFLRSRGAN